MIHFSFEIQRSTQSTFVYLGCLIHQTLTSGADVDRRIKKASAAFGALQDCFFKHHLPSLKDKGLVFSTLVVSTLLYGCEVWPLKKKELRRLSTFYNRCVRSMCRVTMKQVFVHRISTADLLNRLGIQSLEYYYTTRLLRWAGHVARMPMSRALLTSWVRGKRPIDEHRQDDQQGPQRAQHLDGLCHVAQPGPKSHCVAPYH